MDMEVQLVVGTVSLHLLAIFVSFSSHCVAADPAPSIFHLPSSCCVLTTLAARCNEDHSKPKNGIGMAHRWYALHCLVGSCLGLQAPLPDWKQAFATCVRVGGGGQRPKFFVYRKSHPFDKFHFFP